MSKTVIACDCGHLVGELLGLIKSNNKELHLHKCLKCRKQITTPLEGGLHLA
jgi:hypothetical protein